MPLGRKISRLSFNSIQFHRYVLVFGEFHLIHAECDLKRLAILARNAHHSRLAVYALPAEHRIFRQLDFHRNHFTHARLLTRTTIAAEHQDAIPADVLRNPRKPLRPRLLGGHMALNLYVHTRALTPIHAINSDTSAL